MVSMRVNLLKKSRVLTEKQYQIERKVLIGAVFGFIVVLACTMSLFAWQVFVGVSLNAVEKKITDANIQLAGLSAASTQQLYIKSRLQMISGFLNGRAETREALQRVFSLPVIGVTVSSVSFEDSYELEMQLLANSIKSFDEVYKHLETSKDFFVKIVNKGVSRSQDGAYAMTLVLSLPQTKEKVGDAGK